MQLFALENEAPIYILHADKNKNYICPECKSHLRARFGDERRPHFYHVVNAQSCKQQGKSALHLQMQLLLQRLYPQAVLEKGFPQVKRICDVCIEEKKIIFEIQCSPISKYELMQRNLDYREEGYIVIWLLYESTFNKRSPALKALEHNPHLFFDESGRIYDKIHSEKLNVEIQKIKPLKKLRFLLSKRKKTWRHHFQGDRFDQCKKIPLKIIALHPIKSFFNDCLNHLLQSCFR